MVRKVRKITEETVKKTKEKDPVIKRTVEKQIKKVDSKLDTVYNEKRKRQPGRKIRRGKLDIPAEYQDPRFVYRQAIKNPKRIQELQSNDWFIVSDSSMAEALTGKKGSTIETSGGMDAQGKEVNHILMAKRKDYYLEDKKEQADVNKQLEDSIQQHNVENAYGKIELNKK